MQSAATTGLPRSVFDLRHRRLQQKTSARTPVKPSLFAITHDVHGECPREDGLFLSDFDLRHRCLQKETPADWLVFLFGGATRI